MMYGFGSKGKPEFGRLTRTVQYSRVPGDRNWHIKTADWNLAGFFTIFRNLLAGIWGSFLRFIETGFRNCLAACREPALTQKVSLRLKAY